jgi:hypothetical protein
MRRGRSLQPASLEHAQGGEFMNGMITHWNRLKAAAAGRAPIAARSNGGKR